jgi:SAM-dependent methyltransferase
MAKDLSEEPTPYNECVHPSVDDELDMQAGGYKVLLVEDLFTSFNGRSARVLDLGCGSAASFEMALRRHPNVLYTGVEQDGAALAQAREVVGELPNVELQAGFGEQFRGRDFDLVLSLSVLEHVKHLDRFLCVSVHAARKGGRIVHRYDLGHALSPATLGERLRVAVAKRLPALVPQTAFTTHPNVDTVVARLSAMGVVQIEVTQAQMPSLKAAMNLLDASRDVELAAQIVELEAALWDCLNARLTADQRDRLFPSVTVSGYRS